MDYIPDNTPNNQSEPYGVKPQENANFQQNQSPSPADIYNATAPQGIPNYHYGAPQNFFNPQYLEEQRQKMLQRRHHEKKIKSLGTNTGIILLIVLAFSFTLSYLLLMPAFSELYQTNLTFASAFGIFYSVITVGGAFLIGSRLMKKNGFSSTVPYAVPKDKIKTLLLILIGFGGCLLANFITSFLVAFAEGFGIYSTYSALQYPSNTFDVIMIFISSALIPPLIEEFALRGILMQSMRKYGNLFAIITSAFVFGVFHGNAVQIPFAFLCGLIIGYAVMATESLWTGVIIHALMNAMSGVSSALIYYFDEYTSNTFFYVGSAIGIALGIVAVIIYLNRYKNDKTLKDDCCFKEATLGEKFLKFNSSPVMIIAIILYIIQALSQLTTTPPTY
ncbi:MAG: CPBP family intramembrane metalloprotease [Clostridia bacterium]|nr:CPBP family intramembrane metalloprotease [Clostridia bacterium]